MNMNIYGEDHSNQRIVSDGKEKSYKNFICNICTAVLLIAGASVAAMYSWSDGISITFMPILTVIITMACCVSAQILKSRGRRKVSVALNIVPAVFVLIVAGFRGYLTGCMEWINIILQHLNDANNGSFVLFKVNADASEVFSFELLLMLLICEGAWHLVFGRKILPIYGFCLLWIVIPIIGGYFHSGSAACLAAALILTFLSGVKTYVLKRDIIWGTCIVVAMGACSFVASDRISTVVYELRNKTTETIYEMRYGSNYMVGGDLREAAKLHESDDRMFTLQSKQEKNIYLRAFAAGNYENGLWSELPNSAYSGTNAGIMDWLSDNDFDPMTQTADYYKLSVKSAVPEKNRISLNIIDAGREDLYVPASLDKIYRIRYGHDHDSRLVSRGLVGARIYSYDEISGTRPSELTVPDAWVSSPENDKQRRYSEAEAVYRQFVYDNYTSISRNIYELVNRMFWENYDEDSNGIYSAVCRVREVLENTAVYTEKPDAAPADKDALMWFLSEDHTGNAVMYASVAVEALRACGIPARYAEGYYISSEDIAAGKYGTVNVTGKKMHAWAEVYFDGVGWMPVDATPGYYYNVMSLQEMVSAPDTVRQTAAIEDDQSQSQDITDSGAGGRQEKKDKIKRIENAAVLTAGAAAVIIVMIAAILCLLELARVVLIILMRRRFRTDSGEKRVRELERRIFRILELRGVEARLGWRTDDIDRQVSEKCSSVRRGEYTRVCAILEKAVYGGIAPEQYEERTLSTFLQKISEPEKSAKWTTCMRIRYMGII